MNRQERKQLYREFLDQLMKTKYNPEICNAARKQRKQWAREEAKEMVEELKRKEDKFESELQS